MKLAITDLTLNYFGHLPSLQGIDATFNDGVHAILGTRGSGKTSLLKSIAGLTSYEGKITLDDQLLSLGRNSQVGLVFDDLGLLERRSVLYNMTYPLRIRNIPKSEWASCYLPALKSWGLQDLFLDTAVRKLPEDVRARLALARAWMLPRKVLLLDDPLSKLAPDERARTFGLLSRMMRARDGITIYATEDVDEVRSLNVPTLLLSMGYAMGQDTPEELKKVKCLYQGESLIPHYGVLDGVCREGKVETEVLAPIEANYPSSYEGQEVLVGVSPDALDWKVDEHGEAKVCDSSLTEGMRYSHIAIGDEILTVAKERPIGETGHVVWVAKPALFDKTNEMRIDRDVEDIGADQ